MKTKLLLIVCVTLIAIGSSGQIPNAEFDNWFLETNGRSSPTDWTSTNTDFSGPTVIEDIGYNGGKCVKLVSVPSGGTFRDAGQISLTNYPYTGASNPVSVSGRWKMVAPNGSDFLHIRIYIYNAAGNNIGGGSFSTAPFTTNLNWTYFNHTISYTVADQAAKYTLVLSWFPNTSNSTGYGFFDDIGFDGITNIENTAELSKSSLAFLSNQYRLNVGINSPSNLAVNLFDIAGRNVDAIFNSNINSGDHSFTIDPSKYAPGIYICSVLVGTEQKTYKLIFN